MLKKQSKIKIKEIAPKIKIIEKDTGNKDVSVLEKELDEDSFVSGNSNSSAANVSIRPSGQTQVVREIPLEPVRNSDPEFSMSKSYNQERGVSVQTRSYSSIQQAARSVDPGIQQNNFSVQQGRPDRFRSQELDSMRTDSLPDSKYQEFESLPQDNKNKRKLPWEI